MRLALAARTYVGEPFLGSAPGREDVVGADEDMDLAEDEIVVLELDRLQDGEQRIAVFLDLGPLVTVARVVDRQLVQIEFLLHHLQLGGLRVLERDPDEAIGPLEVFADILDGDIGELAAFGICDAVDKHGEGPCALPRS